MAQLDAAGGEHAIDIEAGGRPTSDCAVCMEPAEWVAVGPCGHREVCASCAVRMRFFDRNRLCCLCRASCPTVVITKAGSTAGQQTKAVAQGDAASAAAGGAAAGAGQEVGGCWLYHGGVAAYFDSPDQYEKARETCLRLSASPPPWPWPRHARQHPDDWALVFFCVFMTTLISVLPGVLIAAVLFQNGNHITLFTLGFGFLCGALTFLTMSWNIYRRRTESQ